MRSVEAVCPRPAKRGEGQGEGPVFTAGPLTRRAFGSSASPPFGGEAQIRIAVAVCVVALGWAARAAAQAPSPAPLTLKEAIEIARAHHPTVEAAGGEVTATLGRKEQALARLLPFVQGGITYQPTTPNLVVSPAESRVLFASSGRDTVIDAGGNPVVVT